MSAQKELNPSMVSKQDLEVLAFMIAAKLNEFADKPMTAKEAQAWMGIGKTKFIRLANEGVIKRHHVGEKGEPMYLRSELIESIKRS